MIRLVVRLLPVLIITGCVTTQPNIPTPTESAFTGEKAAPSLRQIPTSQPIYFGYKIYGDPGAAPSQAFDDGRFLFLQFRQGVPPPIATTRDGKLLEYEVMAGGIVRTSKVDSVVLRLGPRVAYVDREDMEIIALPPLDRPTETSSLVVERPPFPSQANEVIPKKNVRRLSFRELSAKKIVDSIKSVGLEPGVWHLCHAPLVRDLKMAKQVKEGIESSFEMVRIVLSDSCSSPGEILLEKR